MRSRRVRKTGCSLLTGLVRPLLVFGILTCLVVHSDAREALFLPLFNVGFRVLDFEYQKDGQSQILTVAVWYPASERTKLHNYGGPASGNVAVDAAPRLEGGPFPLLIFSHGYGGSGLASVFFTEALAARGWIVACPDHHDKFSAARIRSGQVKHFDRLGLLRDAREIAASGPGDRGRYLYRLDELRLALDGMLASRQFGKLVDNNRIAVGGHSFGGFTALGLCGTLRERHDPRIKAVLLFSTGAGGYLFREDELAAVHIPSMLIMGEREEDQRRGSRTMSELSARIFRNVSAPKYFLEVRGASHFSFNNRFSDNRWSKLLSGTEEQFAVIRRYSIAFLEQYVARRKDFPHVLEKNDPLLVRYVKESVQPESRKSMPRGVGGTGPDQAMSP